MLSEVSQVVTYKYHMTSPISGNQSTKQTSKQNITRDSEIRNKLTVSRGEVGGDKGGEEKGERFSGTYIKDTCTKPKGSMIEGGRWGWLRWEEVVGGKWRQLYLNNNKK